LNNKIKPPYNKNDHAKIVKMIADGLYIKNGKLNYLEIGIRKSPTFNAVSPLCKEAYAVDINKDCLKYIDKHPQVKWNHMTSHEFLENHDKKNKFDLIFLDGCHEFESTKKDFELSFELLKEDGIILLHDVYPPSKEFISKSYCDDAYKVVNYIRYNYFNISEYCTLPFYFGIGIIRKRKRHLVWDKKGEL
jgi:spermidine synthase